MPSRFGNLSHHWRNREVISVDREPQVSGAWTDGSPGIRLVIPSFDHNAVSAADVLLVHRRGIQTVCIREEPRVAGDEIDVRVGRHAGFGLEGKFGGEPPRL